jgi:repressor LexA
MENKQDGKKTRGRAKAAGPDERQLDLWSLGGGGTAPAQETVSRNEPQPVESAKVFDRSPPVVASVAAVEAAPPAAVTAPAPAASVEPAAGARQADEQRREAVAPLPAPAGVARMVPPSVPASTPKRSPADAAVPRPAPAATLALRGVSAPATPATPGPARARTAAPLAGAERLPPLTRRQHDLLIYLRERRARGDRAPSLGEICKDLGLASRGSLHKQVVALVEAGLVEAMNGKQRGVRLVDAANDADGAIPLLGAIAAGRPIEALIRDESVTLPDWLRVPGPCYALRVKGDSMRDAGILDGDVVVVEQRQHARNGETVVALIDGEAATLKRIEQTPGEIVLHAENPAYAPQRYRPDQVAIQGVLVAALRRY